MNQTSPDDQPDERAEAIIALEALDRPVWEALRAAQMGLLDEGAERDSFGEMLCSYDELTEGARGRFAEVVTPFARDMVMEMISISVQDRPIEEPTD